MRRFLPALLLLLLPLGAWAEGTPAAGSAATATASSPSEAKHDVGTVRTVDAQNGMLICDLPDGPVTYDVSNAQLIDQDGKPAGAAAANLKQGQKVRLDYVVQNGAKVSEVRLVK